MDSLLIGAIVGGVVAALVVIVLVTAMAICFYSSYKKSKPNKQRYQTRSNPKAQPKRKPTAAVKRPVPKMVPPYFYNGGIPSPTRKTQWNQRMLQQFYPYGGRYIMPMPMAYPVPRHFPQLPETRPKDSTRDDESVSEEESVEEIRQPPRPPPPPQPFVFTVPPMYYNLPFRGRPHRPQSSVVIREIENDGPVPREPEVHERNETVHTTNINRVEIEDPVVSSMPGDVIFERTTAERKDAHGLYSVIDSGLNQSAKVRTDTILRDPIPASSNVYRDTQEVETETFQTYQPQTVEDPDVEYTVFVRRSDRGNYSQNTPASDTRFVNIPVSEPLTQTVIQRPPTPPYDIENSDPTLFTTAVNQVDDVKLASSTRNRNFDNSFSLVYMDSIKQAVESRAKSNNDYEPALAQELNASNRFSYRPPTPPQLTKKVSSEYYDNREVVTEVISGENLSKTVQFNKVAPVIIPDTGIESLEDVSPVMLTQTVQPSGYIPPPPPLPPQLNR